MADPPVEAGAVKATEALVGDEAVAEPTVGAPGEVAGVTETAVDAAESPVAFTALRVIE